MSNLGGLIGKVAGKVVNAATTDKRLKCADCGRITNHIPVSLSDVLSRDVEEFREDTQLAKIMKKFFYGMGRVGGVGSDLTPGLPLVLGNSYSCFKCNRIRFEGGALSEAVNKETKLYL